MVQLLSQALPDACTIYHSLQISHLHEGSPRYGELDVVVVFPSGHLAVLEVKAGQVDLSERGAFKRYGSVEKNLAHQAHAQTQLLDAQGARMLFVAMTRAQSQLHLVMSAAAERALTARLESQTTSSPSSATVAA